MLEPRLTTHSNSAQRCAAVTRSSHTEILVSQDCLRVIVDIIGVLVKIFVFVACAIYRSVRAVACSIVQACSVNQNRSPLMRLDTRSAGYGSKFEENVTDGLHCCTNECLW